MSRLGKQVIQIPENIQVKFENGCLSVSNQKGTLKRTIREEIGITVEGDTIKIDPLKHTRLAKSLWGTYAAHIVNMIKGLTDGHKSTLVVEGVGYKVDVKGKDLVLIVGYSNPVIIPIEDNLSAVVEKNNIIISGSDIEQVTAFAAKIRMVRKPEPYKGKGIRYIDEVVRRKQGKRAATTK